MHAVTRFPDRTIWVVERESVSNTPVHEQENTRIIVKRIPGAETTGCQEVSEGLEHPQQI